MTGPSLRIIVPRYGERIVGGTESLIRSLAMELVSRSWHIEVWTTTALDEETWRNALPLGRAYENGVHVHRFATALPRFPRLFRELTRGFFRMPTALRPEHAWLALQGPFAPQLVRSLHSASPMPTLLTPYLYYPVTSGIRYASRPRILMPAAHNELPLKLRTVRREVMAADALWYHTIEERQLLESTHRSAKNKPSAVGTVGVVPPRDANPERFRSKYDIRSPYFLYGGRTVAGKGTRELIAGVRELRRDTNALLIMAGEASHDTVTDGILPVGYLSRTDWWDALAGATAVIVPSFRESLSLLALEAWSVGRPVIVNAASPVLAGQAQRSKAALTYGNHEELVSHLKRVLADPDFGKRLGAAGLQYVMDHYTWDGAVQRLKELIDTCAQPPNPQRFTR